MIRIFVRHKVDDYAIWRKGYDAFESARTKLGVRGHAVYTMLTMGMMSPYGTTLTASKRPKHSAVPMN